MRIILVATLVMAAASWFGVRPASAAFWQRDRPLAPWCAVFAIGPGDTQWDCVYPTLEACVPFVIAGTRGFCNPNPAYPGPVEARPKPHRHR